MENYYTLLLCSGGAVALLLLSYLFYRAYWQVILRLAEAGRLNPFESVRRRLNRSSELTRMCYQVGIVYRKRNEPIIGEKGMEQTPWGAIQKDMITGLKRTRKACRKAIKIERRRSNTLSTLASLTDIQINVTRQLALCTACPDLQKQNGMFFCPLAEGNHSTPPPDNSQPGSNDQEAANMNFNGEIQL